MSDSEGMVSLLQALGKLVDQQAKLIRTLQAQTKAINQLAASNADMADAMFAAHDEEEQEQNVDMAGNPIRVS